VGDPKRHGPSSREGAPDINGLNSINFEDIYLFCQFNEKILIDYQPENPNYLSVDR